MSTVVAAGLLIGAIVGLYIEPNPVARLTMISCFTALFALNVGLLTNAGRAEVFASTAAYAAVLVVFVSRNLSNYQSDSGNMYMTGDNNTVVYDNENGGGS